jgi:tricorn protease-like protein
VVASIPQGLHLVHRVALLEELVREVVVDLIEVLRKNDKACVGGEVVAGGNIAVVKDVEWGVVVRVKMSGGSAYLEVYVDPEGVVLKTRSGFFLSVPEAMAGALREAALGALEACP